MHQISPIKPSTEIAAPAHMTISNTDVVVFSMAGPLRQTLRGGKWRLRVLMHVVSQATTPAQRRSAMSDMSTNPDVIETAGDATYRVTANELRQFVERIERLDAEKKDLAEQQKEVMAEAKSRGYDTKVLRKVIALRKRDKDDIAEEEAVMEMYKEALGM
jgi:uncharacterized protein (UPF0335 family)